MGSDDGHQLHPAVQLAGALPCCRFCALLTLLGTGLQPGKAMYAGSWLLVLAPVALMHLQVFSAAATPQSNYVAALDSQACFKAHQVSEPPQLRRRRGFSRLLTTRSARACTTCWQASMLCPACATASRWTPSPLRACYWASRTSRRVGIDHIQCPGTCPHCLLAGAYAVPSEREGFALDIFIIAQSMHKCMLLLQPHAHCCPAWPCAGSAFVSAVLILCQLRIKRFPAPAAAQPPLLMPWRLRYMRSTMDVLLRG